MCRVISALKHLVLMTLIQIIFGSFIPELLLGPLSLKSL